jgi:hypothetical protein
MKSFQLVINCQSCGKETITTITDHNFQLDGTWIDCAHCDARYDLDFRLIKTSRFNMTTEEIAIKFSKELLKEIGIDNLREVNELNLHETNSQICYSHDFTDANQIMLDVIGNPEDVENIWEEVSPAWALAKQNNFYIK